MTPEKKLPWRPPCAEWPTRTTLYLGCANHARRLEADSEPLYENDGAGTHAPKLTCDPPISEPPPCGPQEVELACNTLANKYCQEYTEIPGSVADYRVCKKRGFKAVQARKVWWGWLPFDAADRCPTATGEDRITFKFRTATIYRIETNYDDDCEPCPGPVCTRTSSRTYTIGRTTGVITQDAYSNTSEKSGACEAMSCDPNTTSPLDLSWNSCTQNLSILDDFLAAHPLPDVKFDEFNNALEYWSGRTCETFFNEDGSPDYSLYEITIYTPAGDCGDYTSTYWASVKYRIELSEPYTETDLQEDIKTLLAYWPMDDDHLYPWRTDSYLSVAPLVTYRERAWVTTDSELPIWQNDPDWVDGNAENYDGEVMGAPLPAGHDRHFSWEHTTHEADLTGISATTYVKYYGAWTRPPGGGLHIDPTDEVQPANATAWTDQKEARDLWPQSYVNFDEQTQTAYAQKHAEILIQLQSQNFARPCGLDRFTPDWSTKVCVTDWTETTITVAALTPSFSIDDLVIFANEGVAAIYKITGVDGTGYVYTVEKIQDKPTPETPADSIYLAKMRWPNAPATCGKNPIATASATDPCVITLAETHCLKTGDTIFAEVDGTPEEFTITVSGSNITLDDYNGTTLPLPSGYAWDARAGAYPLYWLADARRKFTFAVATWARNYRDVAEVPGTRANQATWGMPETVAEQAFEFGCLPFNLCNPLVVCVSPNAEEFPAGITYPFPTACTDQRYGALWQAEIQQRMFDRVWQVPPAPCGYEGLWAEAGTGATDDANGWSHCPVETEDARFFPRRPFVERMIAEPDGLAWSADGKTWRCAPATLAELDVDAGAHPTALDWIEINTPPPIVGPVTIATGMQPYPVLNPWLDQLADEACV